MIRGSCLRSWVSFSNRKSSLPKKPGRRVLIASRADRWLQRNATHFLKIAIPRVPSAGTFEPKHPD